MSQKKPLRPTKINIKQSAPTAVLTKLRGLEKAHTDTRIRQVFLNVPMVNRLIGLSKIAQDAGISVDRLREGDFLVFINNSRSKLALLGSNGFVGYLYHPQGHILDLRILSTLPKIFRGKDFHYDQLLKPFLEEYLAPKKKQQGESTNDHH